MHILAKKSMDTSNPLEHKSFVNYAYDVITINIYVELNKAIVSSMF